LAIRQLGGQSWSAPRGPDCLDDQRVHARGRTTEGRRGGAAWGDRRCVAAVGGDGPVEPGKQLHRAGPVRWKITDGE